jgi:hypothetical protein
VSTGRSDIIVNGGEEEKLQEVDRGLGWMNASADEVNFMSTSRR